MSRRRDSGATEIARSGAAAVPLLSPRGMLLALGCALVLAWPMLATGSYLIFSDTDSYIRGGEIIWRMALDMAGLDPSGGSGGAPAGGGGDGGRPMVNERGQPYVVRSFIYSAYTFAAGAAIWPAGFALLQAAMTLWLLFALIGPAAAARPGLLTAAFLYLAALTTLPWFASYLMPDLLAAAVVIYAAILVRRFDALVPWQRLAIGAIAAFAIAAHYGHGPLAAGLLGAVLLWRLVTRRLTLAVTVAAVLPVFFAPLANLGASSVALDTPSVTPLRLPILLARSIQDGPARWYLEEACPEAPLAFCEAFGEDVPDSIPEFLWGEGGIDSLTSEQMARIREEEFTILAHAFLAYPVAQTASVLGNTARQTTKVGTGEISPGERDAQGRISRTRAARAEAVLALFDRITPIATWSGAVLVLGLLLARRLDRNEIEVLGVVVLGLALNAMIFGGLSAPVDRYQSRLVWLIPALAGIFLASACSRRDGGPFSEHGAAS
jgi:hypothetical protein